VTERRRPLIPLTEAERIARLAEMGLDAEMMPPAYPGAVGEREAARHPGQQTPPKEQPMATEVTVKTPVLADKRLWLAVATVASLLVAKVFGITLDPELLATIAVTVVGYITNSAVKEARVASAVAHKD
jgi:hypothetical protein